MGNYIFRKPANTTSIAKLVAAPGQNTCNVGLNSAQTINSAFIRQPHQLLAIESQTTG